MPTFVGMTTEGGDQESRLRAVGITFVLDKQRG